MRLMPMTGPVRQADIIPFGDDGREGRGSRGLEGAMHARKQLRAYGMCGSMLGPGPFSETEYYLEGWAAGRLRRLLYILHCQPLNKCRAERGRGGAPSLVHRTVGERV